MDEDLSVAIAQEWGLDTNLLHSKEEILAALAARIGQLFTVDTMAFIQLMYRLDIPERQLEAALEHPNAAEIIAQLIWDRQLQKYMMRKATPPPPANRDEELSW
jgi:hypothetical protein